MASAEFALTQLWAQRDAKLKIIPSAGLTASAAPYL